MVQDKAHPQTQPPPHPRAKAGPALPPCPHIAANPANPQDVSHSQASRAKWWHSLNMSSTSCGLLR
jgi:hypothetical protein